MRAKTLTVSMRLINSHSILQLMPSILLETKIWKCGWLLYDLQVVITNKCEKLVLCAQYDKISGNRKAVVGSVDSLRCVYHLTYINYALSFSLQTFLVWKCRYNYAWIMELFPKLRQYNLLRASGALESPKQYFQIGDSCYEDGWNVVPCSVAHILTDISECLVPLLSGWWESEI